MRSHGRVVRSRSRVMRSHGRVTYCRGALGLSKRRPQFCVRRLTNGSGRPLSCRERFKIWQRVLPIRHRRASICRGRVQSWTERLRSWNRRLSMVERSPILPEARHVRMPRRNATSARFRSSSELLASEPLVSLLQPAAIRRSGICVTPPEMMNAMTSALSAARGVICAAGTTMS